MLEPTPYGEWPSPITVANAAGDAVSFAGLQVDGDDVWWLERRPEEGGRGVLVRQPAGEEPTDVTPESYDVRTLVHQYGGGDALVSDGTAWFSNFDDQRLYRQEPGGEPEPITPEPEVERGDRYADADLVDGTLYCVRERHGGADEPENHLVRVPVDGGEPTVVAEGHDFYSFPRASPDGARLAWTTWDHPAMPWDTTDLHVARIDDDGTLIDQRTLLGEEGESVFQPQWDQDGRLYAVSDRTGWWNVYRVPLGGGEPEAIHVDDAEYGLPQWQFGYSTYAFLDDGRIAAAVGTGGDRELRLVDPGGSVEQADLDGVFPLYHLHATGDGLAFVAAGPTEPAAVVRWTPGDGTTVLGRSFEVAVDEGYLPRPETITFPTTDDEVAHAHYYPPRNPDADGPDDDRPPLIVTCHGGPTGEALPELSLSTAFWTSRGFAVVDVNYRGSSGYGRAYRERLYGEWGVVDVVDCVNVARHLADEDLVDGDRQAIRGGSAGGYVTLCALAFHDTFDAGASYCGIADLRNLAETTHKFESRYLDRLVGPLPDAEEIYRKRSPIHNAGGIDGPLLLLQGSEDAVVPPDQTRSMVETLAENDVPNACIVFENERHGFRRAASREWAIESELAFYAAAFDLDPAEDPKPVTLAAESTVETVDPE